MDRCEMDLKLWWRDKALVDGKSDPGTATNG
jgi:hypothetical protein